MNEKLRQYMDSMFAEAPATTRMVELREEILQNLTDKYNDLIAEGKTEEAAFNIAAASIGDVRSLIKELSADANAPSVDERERAGRRSAICISVAVALYIVAVVPVILLGSSIGVVLMFVLAAIATGLLIYNNAMKNRYVNTGETVVEDFKAWKQENSNAKKVYDAISGALWLVIVCVYLFVSFMTGAWHITWLIFPLGAAISLIVSGIFDLKK